MTQEPINTESSLEEQLVAYLDGELDSESCRRIEELLAVDPEVRRKLHWLEQTWEMLDELETTPVGDDFTRTTLEMVAVAAAEDVRKNREEAPRRRRRGWLLCGASMFAAGLVGFMAFTLTASNPNKDLNEELIQDLPVLENLDEYRQIQDIKFLHMLQKNENLFPKVEETASSPPTALHTGKDLVQYIKALNPSQKEDLRNKQERFANLDRTEQNRLRHLHEQIQEDKNPDELRDVMNRYYEWYKSLPPYNRPELASLPAEERIQLIKLYKQEEQTKITNRPPAGEDSKALWSWMGDIAAKREKTFSASLPPRLQKNLTDMSPAARRQFVMWMMWQRPQGGPNREPLFSDSDLTDLLQRFTAETRTLLAVKAKADQIRIIQNWAHNLLRQKNPRHGSDVEDFVKDEPLAEFFEKDLTNEQRDRLMTLSSDDMQRELLRLYIMQNRPPEMPPHRPEELHLGPPPGAGNGPDHRTSEKPEQSHDPEKKSRD